MNQKEKQYDCKYLKEMVVSQESLERTDRVESLVESLESLIGIESLENLEVMESVNNGSEWGSLEYCWTCLWNLGHSPRHYLSPGLRTRHRYLASLSRLGHHSLHCQTAHCPAPPLLSSVTV